MTNRFGPPARVLSANIKRACSDAVKTRRVSVEIAERGFGKCVGFDLDSLPEDHDLVERWPMGDVSTRLPRHGLVEAWVSDRDGDLIDILEVRIEDGEVVAIGGKPWSGHALQARSCPPPPPPEAEEAAALVSDTVRRLWSSLRRSKDYQVPDGLRPVPRISWSAGRIKSRGGLRGVSLALRHWVRPGLVSFREYAHIAADPEIGSLVGPWQVAVQTLTAHELAHYVQYQPGIRKPPADYRTAHGLGWQEIYRRFRQSLARAWKQARP